MQGSGDTLADLLTDLDRQYPGIKGRLITEDGGLHRFVNVYVNDEDVRFLGGARRQAQRRRLRDHPAGGRRVARSRFAAQRTPCRG